MPSSTPNAVCCEAGTAVDLAVEAWIGGLLRRWMERRARAKALLDHRAAMRELKHLDRRTLKDIGLADD